VLPLVADAPRFCFGGRLVAESLEKAGAARGIRTPDPIITNDVLYRLSYCGIGARSAGIKARWLRPVLNANDPALQVQGRGPRARTYRICAARKRSKEAGLSSGSAAATPGSSGACGGT
jgi:hypothetical protein